MLHDEAQQIVMGCPITSLVTFIVGLCLPGLFTTISHESFTTLGIYDMMHQEARGVGGVYVLLYVVKGMLAAYVGRSADLPERATAHSRNLKNGDLSSHHCREVVGHTKRLWFVAARIGREDAKRLLELIPSGIPSLSVDNVVLGLQDLVEVVTMTFLQSVSLPAYVSGSFRRATHIERPLWNPLNRAKEVLWRDDGDATVEVLGRPVKALGITAGLTAGLHVRIH